MRQHTLLSLLLLLSATHLFAQLEILYPLHGQKGVEQSPEIVVRAPAPIERSSVSSAYPDANVMGMLATQPTVLIVDTAFDQMPLSTRIRASASGTYRFSDPRTFSFTPKHLVPGRTYRVTVDGVWLRSPGLVAMSPATTVFTVAKATPSVVNCSLSGVSQISCSDAITVTLSDLPDGGLGDAHKVMRLEKASPETNGRWELVQTDIQIDGSKVFVRPAIALVPADLLKLTVSLSEITGNPLDNRTFSSVVRTATTVHVTAVSQDGRDVPDDISRAFEHISSVYPIGTTIPLVAQQEFADRWRLIGWECDTQTLPEGSVSRLETPCVSTPDDVFVRAVLAQADTIRIALETDSTGRILVYDANMNLVQTVTSSDTIKICNALQSCVIVAMANTGYTFQNWQAAGLSVNQNTAPVVHVGAGIMGQAPTTGNAPTVNVQAKFNKLITTAEIYTLRGEIEDVDEIAGYSAEDGVSFTTKRIQTGTVPVKENICIKAKQDWEIIGYMSSVTGGIETYDEPRQEACVSDFMYDPENVITFFVQRKQIQLRVEQVLLASDDTRNLLSPDRFSSHAKVTVELQKKVGSRITWSMLTEQICKSADVRFARYLLRSGDVVRITPIDAETRNQKFRFFDAIQSYVLPDVDRSDDAVDRYQLPIQPEIADFEGTACDGTPIDVPEIRMRACYRQGFGIEAIGLSVRVTNGTDRSKATFEERWIDPLGYRTYGADEPKGGRQIEYVPREGALIKIKFSMPIDQQAILDGAIGMECYNNVLYSDPAAKDLDFEVNSTEGNVSFESEPGESARTVVLSIKKPLSIPLLQALHCGIIKLYCTSNVKSLTGTPLEHTSTFVFQNIEIPGYSLQLHDIDFAYDGDADFIFENDGEIYHATFGGDFAGNVVYGIDEGFRRIPDCAEQQGKRTDDCTLEHSDKDGPQGYGDMLLWIQPNWLDWPDLTWWYASSYDEDCKDVGDCFVNQVQTLLTDAKKLAKELVGSGKDGTDVFNQLITFGSDFVSALLPTDEQDRHLGYGNFIGSGGNFWNAKRSTKYFEIGDENTTYRLLPNFLVSKGVIR